MLCSTPYPFIIGHVSYCANERWVEFQSERFSQVDLFLLISDRFLPTVASHCGARAEFGEDHWIVVKGRASQQTPHTYPHRDHTLMCTILVLNMSVRLPYDLQFCMCSHKLQSALSDHGCLVFSVYVTAITKIGVLVITNTFCFVPRYHLQSSR